MKIAVVSDTHGSIDKVLNVLKNIKNLELIIHLGDYVDDSRKIQEEIKLDVICVRGNCDYRDTDIELEKIIEICGKKIFMTHGHNYDVKNGVSKLFYRGKELNADIILFGHSHMSTKVEHEGILILNPGSPQEPRNGSKGSIGLVEITEKEIKSDIIIL